VAEFLPPLLTIPEAAEALRVGERTIYNYIADGDLDVVDIPRTGSRRSKSRVPCKSIEQFIERRTRNAKRLLGKEGRPGPADDDDRPGESCRGRPRRLLPAAGLAEPRRSPL
jgi:excisionase family DNA binding protein